MSLPYFPLYPTDFEADTSHLTLAEDGAYNRLLRLMWMTTGCTLPDDNAWIKRRMRVDQETFDSVVVVVIAEFFQRKAGRIISPRLAKEYQKTDLAHKKRVAAGSKGGKAKAAGSLDKDPSKAKAMPKQPEPEPEPIERDTSVSTKKPTPSKPKRACSIPDGWVPNDRNIQDAIDRSFSQQEMNHEANQFRDYHLAKGTTYKDWNAAWRTWLGNARKFARTNGNNGTSRPGSGTAQAFAATAIKLRDEQDGGGNNIADSELPF